MRSSSLSFLWILFLVDCLLPLCLVSLVGYYLASSPATYSSVVSFCLTCCVCGLLSTDCRAILALQVSAPGGWGCFRDVWTPGGREWGLHSGGWGWVLSLWWGGLYFKGCVWGSLWAQYDFGQPVGGAASLSCRLLDLAFSTGTCRVLGGDRSWCQDGTSRKAHADYSLGQRILCCSRGLDLAFPSQGLRFDSWLGNQDLASHKMQPNQKKKKKKEKKIGNRNQNN